MATYQLGSLDAFNQAEHVLEWYLSFNPSRETKPTARSILDAVTSLDLSKNNNWPSAMHLLLPNLETLTISNNHFRHIPSTIVLFVSLRKLRRHGNELVKMLRLSRGKKRSAATACGGTCSNTKQLVQTILARRRPREKDALERGKPSSVPSLVWTSIQLLHLHLPSLIRSFQSPVFEHPTSSYRGNLGFVRMRILPSFPHASDPRCRPPPPAFLREVYHLDPGVSIPSQHPTVPRPVALNSGSPGESLTPAPSRALTPSAASNRYLLTLEERVLSALHARSSDKLQTIVIGDSKGHRFCYDCGAGHLSVDDFREVGMLDSSARKRRECEICKEERRVKVKGNGEGDRRG